MNSTVWSRPGLGREGGWEGGTEEGEGREDGKERERKKELSTSVLVQCECLLTVNFFESNLSSE